MSALVSTSVDEIGRELARRVEQRAAAARACCELARASDDLVTIADSAEGALWAASQASDWAIAVRMIIGAGDVALVDKTSRLAREAAADAAYCGTRWGLVRRQRGMEARA